MELSSTRVRIWPVLSTRAAVDETETERFVADALDEIRAYMHGREIEPAGPPFAITHPGGLEGTVDVEAGWLLDRPVAGERRIHGGTLPVGSARPSVRWRALNRLLSEPVGSPSQSFPGLGGPSRTT
jgi:hypothetical protein